MYVGPHLYYGDVIYHNQRDDLMDLIERVQYKAAFIVSGCWQGTRRVKLYDVLGCESSSDGRMVRRLTTFYKIINGLAPSDHIPNHDEININFPNRDDTTPLIITRRHENSFFPYNVKAWKDLNEEAKSNPSIQSFKQHLNNFIRPLDIPIFEYLINLGLNYSPELELVFQIYVIIGSIIILTVNYLERLCNDKINQR